MQPHTNSSARRRKRPARAWQACEEAATQLWQLLLPRAQVAASSRPAAEEFVCPALECANKYAKTECVHPGRPVAQACKDCPRKGKRAAMAKSKCIHPQRPLSQACADCPRRKK